MANTFRTNVLCRPLGSLIARQDFSAYGARWNLMDRVNSAIHGTLAAERDTTLDPIAKQLAQEKVLRGFASWKHRFQQMGLLLSKFDALSIAQRMRENKNTVDLADRAVSAINTFKAKVLRFSDFMNEMSAVGRRLEQHGMKRHLLTDQIAYLAFATGNADSVTKAMQIEGRKERIAALKLALMDDSKAHNFTSFKLGDQPLDQTRIRNIKKSWINKSVGEGGITDQMWDDMGVLYHAMGQVREDYKNWWIPRWKAQNPQGRMSNADYNKMFEEALFEEVGGTFGAFMPRIWFDEWRTGFMDELTSATARSGGWDLDIEGIHIDGQVLPFSQLLRKIAGASNQSPLVLGKGPAEKAFFDAQSAVNYLFPGLSETRRRELPGILRHLVNASNDTIAMRAVPNAVRDAFFQHRMGVLGFEQSFIDSTRAYLNSGSRARELGPLLADGGELNTFLHDLSLQDSSAARALTTHIDALIGRNGSVDLELVGMMHPFARAAANAIFLYNPGPAMLNLSSIVLQAIPFSMSDGFIAGTKDLLNATLLLTRDKKLWSAFYDEARLGGSFAYGFATGAHRYTDVAKRLSDASKTKDLRGAFIAAKELGVSTGEWLAWTESTAVRPFAAALGMARFYRLHPEARGMTELSEPLRQRAISEMMSVIDQTTTLQGGINSIPAINAVRTRLPVIGSMATMLTTTPTNLAAQFVRDLRLVGSDPRALVFYKGADQASLAATRRLITQITFGTAVAGPYWLVPLLRDMDTEDQNKLVAFFNAWEEKFSFAGWSNSELATRLNPVQGVTERFSPSENPLLNLAFGPLGRPLGDVVGGAFGDAGSSRRALGFLSGYADLPPDNILPSSLQYTAPAGIAAEKILRLLASFHPNAAGKVELPLGFEVAVPTLDGNRVDVNGRPFLSDSSFPSKARSFLFGGRQLDEAKIAAEGGVSERKEDRRARVEQKIKRLFLEGDIDGALRAWSQNAGLGIKITGAEMRRENINRHLLPIGRLQLQRPKKEAIERAVLAAQRLEAGGLTEVEAKEEQHALWGAMIRFSR